MFSFRGAVGMARAASLAGAALLATAAQPALAQRQVTAGVPFRSVSDSFFERIGVGANFRGPGFNVNQGGFPLAVPPFGGFQPGAGVAGGFGINGGKFGANVGYEFSQGSRRSNVSQTGSLTNMDGVPGIFADVTQSPFVISHEPIVPLRAGVPWKQQIERSGLPLLGSSQDLDRAAPTKPEIKGGADRAAGAGDAAQVNRPILSVVEIRRQRQAAEEAKNDEVLQHFQRGEQAERDGKPGVAKIHYQMALRRATGELKRQLQERIEILK